MLDQETLRARALEQVLYDAAWKNERVANKFRGTIWILVGIAMMAVSPSATPVVHFSWGVLVLLFDAFWMKRRYRRWMSWVLTSVDLVVLVLGMHAGYVEVVMRGDPLFAEHHLTGTAVGTMAVLGVNMMRFSWRLSIWSTLVAIAGLAWIRLHHDRFDALTLVDMFLFSSLCAMLVYTSRRFKSILAGVMLDLRQVQEARLDSLSRLVAGIAHEMNTPLGALKSNTQVAGRAAEMLKSSAGDAKKTDRALNALDQAQRAGATAVDRMSSIVESLKRFARLDQAEVQLADLRESLEACLDLLPSEAKSRIAIEKKFGEVPRISCRPGQLNQAFMNLLENAVQAIDGDGKIEVSIADKRGQIEIEIQDSGRGIAPDKLARIFDPTFSSGGARTKMGLGLASSRSILSDHGGTLSISSEPGRGTTVTVRLPA